MAYKRLDEVPAEGQQPAKKYNPDHVEVAVRMGVKMIRDGGGLKIISEALNKSKDPAQVIGQFLAQLIGKLAEQLRSEFNIDPGLFVANGGFLDHILDYIEQQLKLPSEFSDQVYSQVMETIKAAAMEPPPPNNVMGGNTLVEDETVAAQGGMPAQNAMGGV